MTTVSGYQDGYKDVNESFFHKEGTPAFFVVVGANAAHEDHEAAVWITQAILKEIIEDKEYSHSYEDYIIFDDELTADMKQDYNLILVGGPIANGIVYELMTFQFTSLDKWEHSQGEVAVIEDVFGLHRHVVIIAGKDREATQDIAWAYSNNLEEFYIPAPSTPLVTTLPPTTTPVPTLSPETYYEIQIGKAYEIGKYTIVWNAGNPSYADFAFIDESGHSEDVQIRYSDDYINANCTPSPDYPDYCDWILENMPNEIRLDGLIFRLGEMFTKHISPIENPVFVTAYVSYYG